MPSGPCSGLLGSHSDQELLNTPAPAASSTLGCSASLHLPAINLVYDLACCAASSLFVTVPASTSPSMPLIAAATWARHELSHPVARVPLPSYTAAAMGILPRQPRAWLQLHAAAGQDLSDTCNGK